MIAKKTYCLAVDDEPLALSVLNKYIASVESLELVGSCANAVQALEVLRQHTVDLIFLDIQMPQIMGTDFIRTLKKSPKVIFTTAFRKYAVEGFELDAVDYLLKPISFERFLKAVNKVLHTEISAPDSAYHTTDNISDAPNVSLYVRSERKMVKIFLTDILYIEGLSDYVKITTMSKTIVTKNLLSSLAETLPADTFLRIHRSFIIALNKIDSFTSDTIEIAKQQLPISRMYRREVEKRLNISAVSSSNANKKMNKKP